ncbi:MAG: 2,3-bisphosphoglycerate-dependent phosphoglycerate mutase [Candidatus Gracilibacteria bacterium]
MPTLVLLRHGQSKWNLSNTFTGWTDIDITEKGEAEATAAGEKMQAAGIKFDEAFTSELIRAQHTLRLALEEMQQTEIPVVKNIALNERDYGDLTGKNKDESRKAFGEAQVLIWRRSYDVAPPNGESLKDTAARSIPYFEAKILPEIKAGKNVIIAAHGNSLRAILMHLEKLTPEEIVKVEIPTGVPIVYEMSEAGEVVGKKVLGSFASL